MDFKTSEIPILEQKFNITKREWIARTWSESFIDEIIVFN